MLPDIESRALALATAALLLHGAHAVDDPAPLGPFWGDGITGAVYMECAAESYFQHSTTQYYGITSGGSTTAYHTTSTNYNGTMYLDDGESVNTANGVFVSTEQSSTDRSFTIEAMNEPEFQDQNCRITFVDGTTLDGTPDADLSEGGFGATSSEFSCTFQWQCRPCGSPPCA